MSWLTEAEKVYKKVTNSAGNITQAVYDVAVLPGALDKLKAYPVTQNVALAKIGNNIYKYAARKEAGIDVSPVVKYNNFSSQQMQDEEKRLKKYPVMAVIGLAAFLAFEGWVHYKAFSK